MQSQRFEASRREAIKYGGAAAAGVSLAGCIGSSSSSELEEVEFWFEFGGDLGEVLQDMVDDYNEETDITPVNAVFQDDNFNTTMSAINAGNQPHITMIADIDTLSALDSEAFTPVESLMGDRLDRSEFLEPIIEYFTIDGTLHSWPFNNSMPVLYYNRDIFAEAGLDPDSPPETFEDVRTYSEAIVAETDAEHGIAWPNNPWFINQWTAIDQEFTFNNANGHEAPPTEILLDTETAERIYTWWHDMYHDGLYLDSGPNEWLTPISTFNSEDLGMVVNTIAFMRDLVDGAEENGFELSTAVLPTPHESFHGAQVAGSSLWVPEASVENDAAAEAIADFLLWVSGPEAQQEWHKRTGYFPVHEDARSRLEEGGWFEENPQFEAGFDQLAKSVSSEYTNMLLYPNRQTIDGKRMDLFVALAQGESPDEMLDTYKDDIDGLLEDAV